MKKLILLLFSLGSIAIQAQHTNSSIPPSFRLPLKSLRPLTGSFFPSLDTAFLLKQDQEFPEPLRYAVCKNVRIDLISQAEESPVEGGRIWRYSLGMKDARSIGIHFSKFHIPAQAGLWLYTPRGDQIFGAVDASSNTDSAFLSLAEFPSDSLIIEYFEPENAPFHGELIIGSLTQAYRDINNLNAIADVETTINIDTRCPQAVPYWNEKHAVCRMTFNDGTNGYLCTGYFINNTASDGTPYFSTANHCISSNYEASTLVIYFNYEDGKCNLSAPVYSTLSGADLKFTIRNSDFTLLHMQQKPLASDQVVYAGWDISNKTPLSVSAIHHPGGKPKVLALRNGPISTFDKSIPWDNNNTTPANTHWVLTWDIGSTAGGSSGCPLFDQNQRAIGQLHGGSTTEDFFGKLPVSYLLDSVNFRKYLDPLGTGKMVIDAFIPDTNLPESYFDTYLQAVCVGGPIKIRNKTWLEADSFHWSVSPSTFRYISQSGPGSVNPEMQFDTVGTYTIKLDGWKNGKQNSTIRNEFITAKNSIVLSVSGVPSPGVLCASKLNDYPIISTGAMNYTYSLDKYGSRLQMNSHNDTLFLSINPDSLSLGGFTSTLSIIGSHGSCVAGAQKILKVGVIMNDDPSTAFPLTMGENGLYTNTCATTFPNEPHPPLGDCYSQDSWCTNTQNPSSILQNTVWFHFNAPASGKVNIFLHGFDAQMALYKANSSSDFTKNPGAIHLLAANDDQPNSVEPVIKPVKVIPGEEYWLQVDGGRTGASDTFSITLLPDQVSAYPNPTFGPVQLDVGTQPSSDAIIEVMDLEGRIMRNITIPHLSEGEKLQFDISELPRGIYLLRFRSSFTTMVTRILKL